ncbi:MAG TPA: hypothetical protein VM285_09735 [Polyangia bacterium]|nr:hypothetical protein [Polyangia bacterium]
MQHASVAAIVEALNASGVRYLLVGGLAVVAHGHVRFTADIDIVVDLEQGRPGPALAALAALGFRPRAPVAIGDFADETKRVSWIQDKGLMVFSLWSPEHPATEIDLFVEQPFDDFAAAYGRAARIEVAPGVSGVFVGLEDLIRLKRDAGRPQDLLDVERLEELREESRHG